MLIAQAVTVTPIPTEVVVPTTTPITDVGLFLENMFFNMVGVDMKTAFATLAIWAFIVWLVFALWVGFDAVQRYKQWFIAFLWFLFVLPFNFIGLIGYIFMRPTQTTEEKQWAKLEGKYLMYELSNVNDCPNCKTLIPNTFTFCPVCGYKMTVSCKGCGTEQSIYNSFCTKCGKTLNTQVFQQESASEGKKQSKIKMNKPSSEVGSSSNASKSDALTSVKAGFSSMVSKLKESLEQVKGKTVKKGVTNNDKEAKAS